VIHCFLAGDIWGRREQNGSFGVGWGGGVVCLSKYLQNVPETPRAKGHNFDQIDVIEESSKPTALVRHMQ
jgi:hypothetical protein